MEHGQEVAKAFARVKSPVFLVKSAQSRGKLRIVVHTADRGSASALPQQVRSALAAQGIDAAYRVVAHKPAKLARAKSLESLAALFGDGTVVYDPTGAVRRAEALVAAAGRARDALGKRARGIFVDARRRALFVILDRSKFAADSDAERVEAMRLVGESVQAWRAADAAAVELTVRIGFEFPEGISLVAVDRASERLIRASLLDRLRKPGIAATLASMLGLGTMAQAVAADATLGSTPGVLEPAVAAPNIGLIAGGGVLNGNGVSNEGWGAVGLKATIPLGERFGAQVDAAVGGNSYSGIGGHLFWRDPSVGLVGIVASTETMSGNSLSRFAVEGELYKSDFTLRGEIGTESGTVTSGVFGGVDVTFYAKPTLALSLGGELGPVALARASVEWQPAFNSIPGLSLFADGQVGSNGDSRVLAGLKYYFGTGGASLKDRDRKYDPDFSLFNTQGLIQGYSAPSVL